MSDSARAGARSKILELKAAGLREKGEVGLGLDYGQRLGRDRSGAWRYRHRQLGSFSGCRMK